MLYTAEEDGELHIQPTHNYWWRLFNQSFHLSSGV